MDNTNVQKDEKIEEEIVETNEDGEELSGKDQVKKLREKLKLAVEEKQTYLANWQRDKADFINARKRDDEAKVEHLKYANQKLVLELLPVLDSFETAIGTKEHWESVSKEWRAGMESVYQQLKKVLEKYHVESFGSIGDPFDANLHHAIGTIKPEGGETSDTLAEILQKGYTIDGKVIRPALVKIFE